MNIWLNPKYSYTSPCIAANYLFITKKNKHTEVVLYVFMYVLIMKLIQVVLDTLVYIFIISF